MLGNMFVFYWAYMQKTKSMLEECPFKMRTAGNLCGWYFIGATFGKKYVFVHFYVTIFMVFEYINNGKGSGKTTERRKQKVKKNESAHEIYAKIRTPRPPPTHWACRWNMFCNFIHSSRFFLYALFQFYSSIERQTIDTLHQYFRHLKYIKYFPFSNIYMHTHPHIHIYILNICHTLISLYIFILCAEKAASFFLTSGQINLL